MAYMQQWILVIGGIVGAWLIIAGASAALDSVGNFLARIFRRH